MYNGQLGTFFFMLYRLFIIFVTIYSSLPYLNENSQNSRAMLNIVATNMK